MSAGELALAVQRHATSKLPDDDLVRISTLGFRGEALPSIGAAARLVITSRPPGAEAAATLTVEGGRVGTPAPAAGPPGTRVVVRDLFYATPARRKFLKSPRAEADAAEAAVRRLALASPQTAMRFESDGRVAFDLPGQDRADRVAALLGGEALLVVEGVRNTLRVTGYAAAPGVTRATAAAQVLVVNGRPVADPVLRIAVRVAYRDVIAQGRHPVVALFLELPADELDVNVHPAKAEVRFRDPGEVRGLVISALTRALAGGAGATGSPMQPHTGRPALALRPDGLPRPGMAEAGLALGGTPAVRSPDRFHGPFSARDGVEFPLGAPVAQVLDTYIIAVAGDGALILVDQHAAHERLTHEALKAQLLAGGVRAQPLLLPAVVDLPPADAARLLARGDDLRGLGLEIEAFGPGAVLVRAMPAALGTPEPGPLLRDLADEFADMDESTVLAARLDAVLARLACHGSIRAGRRLGIPEMDALLRQMEATPRADTCSHGRPTWLKLTRSEIERLFGRR
jgi:DNA mismatch repair protein MutL